MKIKEVCEKTGLTDCTVRYYIECGLLTPDSKDTYAGRKNYIFTREDVERLEKIKVLRGAGFGVEQIKNLLADRSTREAVTERLQELESDREKNEQLYEALQKADIDREVSVDELVIILSSTPAAHCEEPPREPDKPRMILYDILMVLHVVALLSLQALQYSQFGWMVDGTQKLWLWLAIGISYWAFYKRSHWGLYITLIGACLLMLATSIVGGFVNGPVMLNETHYAMVDQIPWDDKEYLAQHGFENDGTWYHEMVLERWDPEKDEAVYYSLDILVRDIDDEPLDLSRYNVHYGDSYIDEYIYSVQYEDVLSEWLRAPCYVDRAFYVISNGKEITFWETDETAPFDLAHVESILEELAAGADQPA